MTLDEFFAGRDDSRALFDALRAHIDSLGPSEMRVTKSQVAWRTRRAFAWAWLPTMYLGERGAPLVMSVALRRRDPSPRWKQVVEPSEGWFMHHLEVRSEADFDDEVRAWLAEAREAST